MTKLHEVPAGGRFTYGGIDWIVLDTRPNMSLCLAADVLKDADGEVRFIPFDTENSNNFATSSLRAWLNEDFLSELVEAGAKKEAFLNMTLDLTSDDGLEDYGHDIVQIGIISCERYRQFRKLIPNASGWWWTCTPFSTARNGYSRRVRCIRYSGTLNDYNACNGGVSARPLCALDDGALVEVRV